MKAIRRVGTSIGDALRIKPTDENLRNTSSNQVWSNQDMDPVAPERRNWSAWTFAGYWVSESWAPVRKFGACRYLAAKKVKHYSHSSSQFSKGCNKTLRLDPPPQLISVYVLTLVPGL